MPSSRPLVRIKDIASNIRLIFQYTDGFDFERFVSDSLVRDGVERCLSRISEAGVKLGPKAAELMPDQDWQSIRHMGNFIRHQYDAVDAKIIWDTISQKLPPLLADATAILARYPPDDEDMTRPLRLQRNHRADLVIAGAQAGVVEFQQAGAVEQFHILVDPAIAAAQAFGESSNIGFRLVVQVAQQVEAFGGHHAGKGFPVDEGQMALGDGSALPGCFPGLADALGHVVERAADMDCQFLGHLALLCARPVFFSIPRLLGTFPYMTKI
jgi:uncharacterized protein with HEPN domain